MRRLTTLILLLVLAAACVPLDEALPGVEVDQGDVDVEVQADGTPRPLAGPDIVDGDCAELLALAELPEAEVEGAVCGFLIVPEDRETSSGPVVEVAWARLLATDGPSDAPLLVLPDGPGQGGLADVGAWVDSPLRAGRDVILIDPRGAGASFPSLDCGQPPRPGALPLDLVEDCRRVLIGKAVDLESYDTAAMAADVADLATALLIPRLAVLGIGHGSRVALAVLRAQPDLLQALVLDSPVPPDVDVYQERPPNGQAALNRLLDECAQQPGCSQRFGGLQQAVEQLTGQLDARPIDVGSGMVIGGADLILPALAAMRGATGPGIVPSALSAAVDGEPEEALERLQEAAISGAAVPTSAFSEGLRLSVDCREEVPFSRVDDDGGADRMGAIGRAVAGDVAELLAACEIWGAGQADDEVNEAVSGDVPTLVLAGEFDPLSPPAWAAATASNLTQATVVQVGGAGHRVHDVDDCTLGLVEDFLTDPAGEVDGACAADRTVEFDLS